MMGLTAVNPFCPALRLSSRTGGRSPSEGTRAHESSPSNDDIGDAESECRGVPLGCRGHHQGDQLIEVGSPSWLPILVESLAATPGHRREAALLPYCFQ